MSSRKLMADRTILTEVVNRLTSIKMCSVQSKPKLNLNSDNTLTLFLFLGLLMGIHYFSWVFAVQLILD